MKSLPLLLHVPHASILIPTKYKKDFSVDLFYELRCMTDWFTDELFDFPTSKLVFPVSRLVCDVERFRDDSAEEMSRRGMGACYTHGHNGSLIRELSKEKKEHILRQLYDPHHARLTDITLEMLRRHGSCLIIDCHSFSNIALPYEPDQSQARPDVCIGTDPFHTTDRIVEVLTKAFSQRGYSVAVNKPYAGTIVPIKYYHTEAKVHSVMIEINRGLYLDSSCRKLPSFLQVKRDISFAIEKLIS